MSNNKMHPHGPVGFEPYVLAPDEEYMNTKQQGHFRKILQLWKQQILEEMERTMDHLRKDVENPPDLLDRAVREEEFSLELRTRDRELKLIRKIDEALDSLDKGDYGYCEECGAEIGIGRLEARPTATQCIDCKTFEEIREKQTGA